MRSELNPNNFLQHDSGRRFQLRGSTLAIVLFVLFAIVSSMRGTELSPRGVIQHGRKRQVDFAAGKPVNLGIFL